MNGHSGDRKERVVADISKQWKQEQVRIAGTDRAQFGSSHVKYEMSCTPYSFLRRYGLFIDAILVTETSTDIYIPKG
jgi:hypothetical protein